MRVMLTAGALKSSISTPLIRPGNMNAERVLSEVSKVLQNNEEFPLDCSFTIDIVALEQHVGAGKTKKLQKAPKVLDYSKDCKFKRSVVTINNSNNLCCPRALVTGKVMADSHPSLKLSLGNEIQEELTVELRRHANVFLGPCGLKEISRFQNVLVGYQVIIVDFASRNSVIYEGPVGGEKIIL